eukprot:6737855-Prymnesium_polylepis.1
MAVVRGGWPTRWTFRPLSTRGNRARSPWKNGCADAAADDSCDPPGHSIPNPTRSSLSLPCLHRRAALARQRISATLRARPACVLNPRPVALLH